MLTTFVLGAITGGAVIFLFPGLGTGGSAIYRAVRDFVERTF